MNDDDLRRAFRELPRHHASPRFEAEVAARLSEPIEESRPLRLVYATAALMLVILGAGVIGHLNDTRREEARIQAIRAEQEAIRAELEELKRLTDEVDPVVYIDGGDGIDFLIDPTPDSQARPAKNTLPQVQ
jgi:hypothetical protein